MPLSRSIALGRLIFAAVSIFMMVPVALAIPAGVSELLESGPTGPTVAAALGPVGPLLIWWFVWDGIKAARWFVALMAGLGATLTVAASTPSSWYDGWYLVPSIAYVALCVLLVVPNPMTRYLDWRRTAFHRQPEPDKAHPAL